MMSEQATTSLGLQSAGGNDVSTAHRSALQARSMDMQLRVAELAMQTNDLREQRDRATRTEQVRLDKQLADAQKELSVAAVRLDATNAELARLQKSQDLILTTTTQPPPAPAFPSGEQIMQLSLGGMLLMFPLVFALARRLWVRGGRTVGTVDIEASPRLQRMEQAIESIAIEVERIGEAQRFATKLLSERQGDPIANRAAALPLTAARREPGTITPH
ncbi:MAG: hypothetical protein ABIP93_10180 [Gemmatimonadaceae bacterium]